VRTCPDCHNNYDDDVLHCPEDGRGLGDLPSTDELIGRTIGSYTVVKQLGKGGMGSVYMGEHPVIGSRVAIKFLHPQYAHDDKIVDRFFNEARAVNVIGHDNILKILDLDITDDHRHYFVMEFLHGRPLQSLIQPGVALPLEVAGPIILQVSEALHAAHRKGIVHRDLKPDNVYLITHKGKKNFVKVVDFGIARVTDDAGVSTGKTQTGMVMGTPAYMSPEQGSGMTSKIDGRSDIYSLGVMMYQLATGKLPFPGSNFGEVLMGHLQLAPPLPRSSNPEIPGEYEAIILKCLRKPQEDRYQSMKDLHNAVEACMDQLGISKDLPAADETDLELAPVDARLHSSPGPRTPGRSTQPGQQARQRQSNPNARPSDPKLRGNARGSPPGAMTRVSRPPRHPSQPQFITPPPAKSKAPLVVGLVAVLLLALGGVAYYAVKSSSDRAAQLATQKNERDAKTLAAKKIANAAAAAADKERKEEIDAQPVSLSVVSEPPQADVTATWKEGGEKKGPAPLSFEVPKNAKVHFEFSKNGYTGYAMDVIADQSQNVHAALKAASVASEERPKKKKKKVNDTPAKDGLIDLDDALK